jgi:ribosomal protein L40E
MAKLPEAEARLFKRIFICKHCKTRIKADALKIGAERIKCRGCGKRAFRPIKKK